MQGEKSLFILNEGFTICQMDLAPVGISVYGRVNHLKQTIAALLQNDLSDQSDVFFFSDAPRPGDEERVAEVRDYLHQVKGFKSVSVIERTTNGRTVNNRTGMEYLLDKYGKMIWLEEDIVTAPGFLSFMKQALERYASHPDVISITGYVPPIKIPEQYEYDAFFLKRFNAWGFGTWRNKFYPLAFSVDPSSFASVLRDRKSLAVLRENGDDLVPMIEMESAGKIDALDVKVMFYQYQKGLYTLYPVQSYVQNIGHDGSGVHCGVSSRFHHDLLSSKTNGFLFPDQVQEHSGLKKAHSSFRKLPLMGKVKSAVKRFVISRLK